MPDSYNWAEFVKFFTENGGCMVDAEGGWSFLRRRQPIKQAARPKPPLEIVSEKFPKHVVTYENPTNVAGQGTYRFEYVGPETGNALIHAAMVPFVDAGMSPSDDQVTSIHEWKIPKATMDAMIRTIIMRDHTVGQNEGFKKIMEPDAPKDAEALAALSAAIRKRYGAGHDITKATDVDPDGNYTLLGNAKTSRRTFGEDAARSIGIGRLGAIIVLPEQKVHQALGVSAGGAATGK